MATKIKKNNTTLKTSEKISLIGNLSTLLAAGIPILEAVESLLSDVRGNQRKILLTLKDDLVKGNRIYLTFAKFPRAFDSVTVNVIRASEEAGTLDKTLKDLQANIKREAEFSDKIRNALIYPTFIFMVFMAVLLVILFVVIPRIATVFTKLKVDLPLPTRILIFMSNLLINYSIFVILFLFVFGGVVYYLYKQKRNVFMGVFYSLPLIKGVVRQIDMTRFSRSMYLLLYSGMPITRALELTEEVVLRRDVAKIIKKSREMVLAGRNLSAGFKGGEFVN